MLLIKRLLQLIGALLLISAIALAGWYQIDGQPSAETDQFITGNNFSAAEANNGDWLFTPTTPNGKGIAIFHGALIKPKSYTKTAAFFADQGYTVWIPSGNFRLSITGIDRFAKTLNTMPQQQWFLLGHSMGGLTALEVNKSSTAQDKISGIAIWAGSMPRDFSQLSKPLLFISGNKDGLLPPERLTNTKNNLPAATIYQEIDGANHKNFALYSHQFFDGEASIPHEQQIDQANALTLAFFQGL